MNRDAISRYLILLSMFSSNAIRNQLGSYKKSQWITYVCGRNNFFSFFAQTISIAIN